jgi:hypothetical protein
VQGVVRLLPLLAQVRRAVSLPLLAAGGIGDPTSARAALASGALAVVMGTRFLATEESDAHPCYKARLIQAEARDTVLTELFDVGWPASPHRVIRNSIYNRWEAAGSPPSGERPGEGEEVAPGIPRYASNPPLMGTDGDIESMAMYAGESVGAIVEVEPAGRDRGAVRRRAARRVALPARRGAIRQIPTGTPVGGARRLFVAEPPEVGRVAPGAETERSRRSASVRTSLSVCCERSHEHSPLLEAHNQRKCPARSLAIKLTYT